MALKGIPLALIVNPKNGALLFSRYGSVNEATADKVIITSLNEIVIGAGYFDANEYPASYLVTGYPRVHTMPGIYEQKYKKGGYGSSLYFALTQATEMARIGRLRTSLAKAEQKDAGISSTGVDSREQDADVFWKNAVEKYGIAVAFDGCLNTRVDFDDDASEQRLRRQIFSKITDQIGIEVAEIQQEPQISLNRDIEVATVTLCGIPVEVMKYKSIHRFVAASFVPKKSVQKDKQFGAMEDVPADWVIANKDVLLASNVSDLKGYGRRGAEVLYMLVEALNAAGASSSEVEEFLARYERGVDAIIRAAAGAKWIRASGGLYPSLCSVCVAKRHASGAIESIDHRLAMSLAARRKKLGWHSF